MAVGEGGDRSDPQPGPVPGQPRPPQGERVHPPPRPPPHQGLPGHTRGKFFIFLLKRFSINLNVYLP